MRKRLSKNEKFIQIVASKDLFTILVDFLTILDIIIQI